MQKGLWKCHEPRVTTNQEVPTIYYHKTKNFNSVFYCYVRKLTYQNPTFMHYLEDYISFSVVFIV